MENTLGKIIATETKGKITYIARLPEKQKESIVKMLEVSKTGLARGIIESNNLENCKIEKQIDKDGKMVITVEGNIKGIKAKILGKKVIFSTSYKSIDVYLDGKENITLCMNP